MPEEPQEISFKGTLASATEETGLEYRVDVASQELPPKYPEWAKENNRTGLIVTLSLRDTAQPTTKLEPLAQTITDALAQASYTATSAPAGDGKYTLTFSRNAKPATTHQPDPKALGGFSPKEELQPPVPFTLREMREIFKHTLGMKEIPCRAEVEKRRAAVERKIIARAGFPDKTLSEPGVASHGSSWGRN